MPAVKTDLWAGTRRFSTVKLVAELAVPPPVAIVISCGLLSPGGGPHSHSAPRASKGAALEQPRRAG